MTPSRKLAFTSVLVILAIGGAFGAYYLNTLSRVTSQQQTISGLQSSGAPFLGGVATTLVLHSPQYLEGVIHHTLILPNTATLGPSYRILGGYVYGRVNLTTTNDNQWEVLLYISNESSSSFVNGTTTNADILKSGGVEIVETGIPPAMPLNSTSAAQSMLGPTVSCVGPPPIPGPNSTCTTQSYTGRSYIVTQNGLSIVVNPQRPALSWIDDRNHMGMVITGQTQSVQQLLGLANSMTQPTR